MNNPEVVTTIISIILSVVSAVLGYLSKKNAKVKKYYQTFIKVEEKIKELCILAEANYKSGDQKKKYVIAHIGVFLAKENLTIEDEVINQIIESVISISKNINTQ